MAIIAGDRTANVLTGTNDADAIRGRAENDTLFGRAGNDELRGGRGQDFLVGGRGDDALWGGEGDDYLFDRGGDNAFHGGEGRDTLSFDTARGPITIDAYAGVAILRSGTSAYDGVEVFVGSAYGDRFVGAGEAETFIGGRERDRLLGGAGDDRLEGGEAADRLRGDGGSDVLIGGEGADRFVFSDYDVTFGAPAVDSADYAPGDGDLIDLARIDAVAATAGDDAFAYIGAAAFTGVAGELRFDAAASRLEGDVTGDGVADFALQIAGPVAPGDLVL